MAVVKLKDGSLWVHRCARHSQFKVSQACVAAVPQASKTGILTLHMWLKSPVRLDEKTKRAIDQLGDVRYIVSSNYEHVKHAPEVCPQTCCANKLLAM